MVLRRPPSSHLVTRTASTRISPSLSSARRSFSSSQPLNMPSSDPNATNFAGLKPDESKALPERSAEPHEEPIIKALHELYTCKPQSVSTSCSFRLLKDWTTYFCAPLLVECLRHIHQGRRIPRPHRRGQGRRDHPRPVRCAPEGSWSPVFERIASVCLKPFSQLFPRADIEKFRILQNPPSVPKSMLLIDQDVAYYRKPESSPTKVSSFRANNLPRGHAY